MSDEEPIFVNCEKHGRGVAAVVCRHLCNSPQNPAGFIENSSEPGDLQAWCFRCEEMFEEEGEMSEAFRKFNDMALVCESCYAEIREKHDRNN
jgi:hypothetical protein